MTTGEWNRGDTPSTSRVNRSRFADLAEPQGIDERFRDFVLPAWVVAEPEGYKPQKSYDC